MKLMYYFDDLFFQIRQFKFTFALWIQTDIYEVKDTQLTGLICIQEEPALDQY